MRISRLQSKPLIEYFLSDPVSIGMRFNDLAEVVRITTTHAGDYWDLILPGSLQHNPVALFATGQAHLQLSKFIRFQNIHTRLKKDKIGLHLVEQVVEIRFEGTQVKSIFHPIG